MSGSQDMSKSEELLPESEISGAAFAVSSSNGQGQFRGARVQGS